MKVYDAPSIRNIALVGHGGCGKTSQASAMLFDMGAVNRLGRVDDGTAPMSKSMAEAREVLPHPPWPTRAMLRMLGAS